MFYAVCTHILQPSKLGKRFQYLRLPRCMLHIPPIALARLWSNASTAPPSRGRIVDEMPATTCITTGKTTHLREGIYELAGPGPPLNTIMTPQKSRDIIIERPPPAPTATTYPKILTTVYILSLAGLVRASRGHLRRISQRLEAVVALKGFSWCTWQERPVSAGDLRMDRFQQQRGCLGQCRPPILICNNSTKPTSKPNPLSHPPMRQRKHRHPPPLLYICSKSRYSYHAFAAQDVKYKTQDPR